MKKQVTLILMLTLLCIAFVFNACKKDDTTLPVITLTGSGSITINLGDVYTDAGATASDDKDGNITSKIVVAGIPSNTYRVGTYTITYNVSDAAGNNATEVSRTLIIKADKLEGTYDVKETNDKDATVTPFNLEVVHSSTTYNNIVLKNFGGYGASISVVAVVDMNNITIATQQFTVSGITYTISGTGGTYDGANFKILTIKYEAKWTESGVDNDINFTDTVQSKL